MMVKENEMTEIRENAKRMVSALIAKDGHAYTCGYLESFLVALIHEHVKDLVELERIQLDMLTVGIEALLDARKAA